MPGTCRSRPWIALAPLVAAVGCGSCATKGPAPETSGAELVEPAEPATGPIVPTPIVVRNDTDAPIALDVGFGPAAAVHVIDAEGTLAPVALHAPPQPCECPCDAPRCTCEAAPAVREIPPAGEHRIEWDATLLRFRPRTDGQSHRCYEREAAPAGAYVFHACDRNGRACATADATLPADAPIVLALQDEERPAADCADRRRLERAVRLALGHATSSGVDPAHVDDCDPAAATCEPAAEHGGDECRISVDTSYDLWVVTVHPAPANGSPRSFEARIDRSAAAPPARLDVSADTWAIGGGGRLRIVGRASRKRHTHGGEAARIGSARFEVDNRTGGPVELRPTRVEWLTSHDCGIPGAPRGGPDEPPLAGARLDDGPSNQPAVTVPEGTSTVVVYFEQRSAYQSWCNRFAARVTFDAGGEMLAPTAEWNVMRVEPLRRP